MARREEVTGSFESHSYAYLHESARFALEQATTQKRGCFYNWLTTMLMTAFCLEAYLNYIGSLLISHWDDDVKRGTNTISKLKILCSLLRMTPEEVKSVIGDANRLITFRNKVVHAQSEQGKHSTKLKDRMPSKFPEVRWAAECTLGNAQSFLNAAEKVIERIHEKAGLRPPALGHFGRFSYCYDVNADDLPGK